MTDRQERLARMEILCDSLEKVPEGYQPEEEELALASRLATLVARLLPPPVEEKPPEIQGEESPHLDAPDVDPEE